jgi:hypothetical protein
MLIEPIDRRRGRTVLVLLGFLLLVGCSTTAPRDEAMDPIRPAGARFGETERLQGPIQLGGDEEGKRHRVRGHGDLSGYGRVRQPGRGQCALSAAGRRG